MYNPDQIRPYHYRELNGKTLEIRVIEDEDTVIIAGLDHTDRKTYVIHVEGVKDSELKG